MTELKHALSGRFVLQTAKADSDGNEIPGTRKVVAPWQDNLITNNGMDYIGGNGASPGNFLQYVSVGSGANPPQFTDNALQARIATTNYYTSGGITSGFTTSAPYFSWYRKEFQFAAGAAAGVLSEIGLTGSGGTPAYTRALIKDSAGNPTTITVLSDELLIITYERRVYCHTEDVVTTATIKGVGTTITIRPSQLGTSGGHYPEGPIRWSAFSGESWYYGGTGVGPSTGVPSGTAVSYGRSSTDAAYISGTYYVDQTIPLTLQDAAGLTLTALRGAYAPTSYQIGFQPGISKTASETVALRLRMSWARYEP